MSDARIIFTQILPNALPPIVVISSMMVGSAILTESALSFLGLGDPDLLSWGSMIGASRVGHVGGVVDHGAARPLHHGDGAGAEFHRRRAERCPQSAAEGLMALLAIQNLTIALPPGADRPLAAEDVSLEVLPKEIVCIVGESGSGKSLTAHAVMGLLPRGVQVTGGSILFDGTDLLREPPEAMRKRRGRDIAMIFQDPMAALNPVVPDRPAGDRADPGPSRRSPKARR